MEHAAHEGLFFCRFLPPVIRGHAAVLQSVQAGRVWTLFSDPTRLLGPSGSLQMVCVCRRLQVTLHDAMQLMLYIVYPFDDTRWHGAWSEALGSVARLVGSTSQIISSQPLSSSRGAAVSS